MQEPPDGGQRHINGAAQICTSLRGSVLKISSERRMVQITDRLFRLRDWAEEEIKWDY
jgi:hypothetical protein